MMRLISVLLVGLGVIIPLGILEVSLYVLDSNVERTKHTYGRSLSGQRYSAGPCVHGWCAPPGVYPDVQRRIISGPREGEQIYGVTYSINEDGFRFNRGAPVVRPAASLIVNFFGGSFIFGEGLNDHETVPVFLSELSNGKITTNNYGFHGYGVHNALKMLEEGVPARSNINILLIGDFHVRRALCKPAWTRYHPRYAMRGGRVSFEGRCDSANNQSASAVRSQWLIPSVFHNTRIYGRIKSLVSSIVLSEDMELFLGLIGRFAQLSLERGEIPIVMLLPDSSPVTSVFVSTERSVSNFLEATGAPYLIDAVPGTDEYQIDRLEAHPNAEANILRSKQVYQYLVEQQMIGSP